MRVPLRWLAEFVTIDVPLEDLLARPRPEDVALARTLTEDVLVLGAGGKMGPSLARRVRRAADAAGVSRRVLAASRFSDATVATALARQERLPDPVPATAWRRNVTS